MIIWGESTLAIKDCEGTFWRRGQHDWAKWEKLCNIVKIITEKPIGFVQQRTCQSCGLIETRREYY